MRCKQKRKFKATTNLRHDFPVAENLLNQTFAPTRPNEAWATDITYISTGEGWHVDGLDGQLQLFYLPPYSPHLNSDDQAWAHVKRRVSKQARQGKGDMRKLALGALRRIQKLPQLIRAFFQQPECRYASL